MTEFERRVEQRAQSARDNKGHHRIWSAIALVVLGVAVFAAFMLLRDAAKDDRIAALESRADANAVAADALHDQIEALGEEPVVDPPAPGAQGVQGIPGPQGEPGPEGERGPMGARGRNGEPGETGPAGQDGEPGAAGSAGPQGEPGPAGPQGEPGPAGPQGEPGPTCPDGYTEVQLEDDKGTPANEDDDVVWIRCEKDAS